MTTATPSEMTVVFNAPDAFKSALTDALSLHIVDEVDALLTEELAAEMGMGDLPFADFREQMITYVEGYLNISL